MHRLARLVQLGLLTFQPSSASYEVVDGGVQRGLDGDYRVSKPELTDFFGVYPTRDVQNSFVVSGGQGGEKLVISGAVSSLYTRLAASETVPLRSQLVLEIQRRDDGGRWETQWSTVSGHETRIGGVVVGFSPSPRRRLRHLLLPLELTAECLARRDADFESALDIDFRVPFLDSKSSGKYRALVREIELHDWPTTPRKWSDINALLSRYALEDLSSIRIVQPMILVPGPSDE